MIIDPHFQEPFRVAQPSDTYARVLEHIPSTFVGATSRLATVIELLSTAMAGSFKETAVRRLLQAAIS